MQSLAAAQFPSVAKAACPAGRHGTPGTEVRISADPRATAFRGAMEVRPRPPLRGRAFFIGPVSCDRRTNRQGDKTWHAPGI
jgi:hypothetical protein